MSHLWDIKDAERRYVRREHRELVAGIDAIEDAARAVGWTSGPELIASIRRVRNWTGGVLMPHAAWEDAVLYPEIDAIVRTPWATKLMRFEHGQIARAAHKLDDDLEAAAAPMTHDAVCAVRAHLSGLAALVRAHVEREDEFLLPLLGDFGET